MRICVCVYVYVCLGVCEYKSMCVYVLCVYGHVCLCVYVCMYVYAPRPWYVSVCVMRVRIYKLLSHAFSSLVCMCIACPWTRFIANYMFPPAGTKTRLATAPGWVLIVVQVCRLSGAICVALKPVNRDLGQDQLVISGMVKAPAGCCS